MPFLSYFIKLALASLIGFLVGLERSRRKNSQIGTGTTSILVVGATLLTIISDQCIGGGDPSRLIANIITAVGFLCGGVIFMKPAEGDATDKELVGLTTSVTLFCLTGVGIAIGLGYYGLAIVATLVVEFNIFISRLIKMRKNKDEDNINNI